MRCLPRHPLIFLLLALPAAAEDVSGEKALEIVKTLASDEFQGRKSGLASGRNAEEWMGGRLEAMGLKPWNGFTFFQDFKASVTEEGGGPPLFSVVGMRDGSFLQDYVTLIYSGKGEVEAEIVFVGYGIHAPDKGWDDYKGLDVKGRIALAVRGKPDGSEFNEERYIGYKSSTAADQGAVGFLLVEGKNAVPGTIQEKYHRPQLPAVWLAGAMADEIFARAKKPKLEQLKKDPKPFPLGVHAKLQIHSRLLKDRPVRNVIGVWPGATDEVVVLGAHLDHVGVDAAGNIYNGADDNGSGSAMLHEVARAITASGKQFKRTLMFVWFAGEEQGLLGSWAFVKKPPVPLEKIAVMINTDMVGQGKPVLAVGGSEVYPRDAAYLGDFEVDGFQIKRFRSQSNSDHYPFQVSGVPAFFVHTQGPHPNYHRPGDDWQNIKPELLEIAGRFVRRLAEQAADSEREHCRAGRHAEFVWNDAPVFGDDLRVQWLDDLRAIDRAITRCEDTKANLLRPGDKIGPSLRDLRPTVAVGFRGAGRDCGAASRMGALFFKLEDGHIEPLAAVARRRPVVLCLDGARPSAAATAFPGAIYVTAREADRWDFSKRDGPWLVVATDVERALELRKTLGPRHVLLAPSGPDTVAALQSRDLKAGQIRQLLGGNLVRMIERLRKTQ